MAKRAGYNKSLIYRYFGDREQLFRAAMHAQFAKRSTLLDRVPAELGSMLAWWTEETRRDPTFVRMILRESLDYAGGDPVESAARTAYYERQLEMLEALEERGEIDATFDREMLFLALLAVVILPAIMPQVVRLVTGEAAGSSGFQERWRAFLRELAAALAPGETAR